MRQFHVPAVANIQNITLAQFKKNAYDSIDIAQTTNINGKNYLLINITDGTPTIYMIDTSNYYVSGYMRQNNNGFAFFCCDPTEVIPHTFSRNIAFNDLIGINNNLPNINQNTTRLVESIKDNLDIVAFLLCESIRFDAIHDFFKFSTQAISCNDLKILTNNWGRVWNSRLHIKKKETLQWLYQLAASDSRITVNPLYQFLETGHP